MEDLIERNPLEQYIPSNHELFLMIGDLKAQIGYLRDAILLLDKHQKHLGEMLLQHEQVLVGMDTILTRMEKRQKKHGALSIIEPEGEVRPSGIILPS